MRQQPAVLISWPQRVLNDLQRLRLSWSRMFRLLVTTSPPPSASCLCFSVFPCVADRAYWREGSVLRIWDAYPGSLRHVYPGSSIPDPNFSIPDPRSKRFQIRMRIKEYMASSFTPKTVSKINYMGCSYEREKALPLKIIQYSLADPHECMKVNLRETNAQIFKKKTRKRIRVKTGFT